MSESGQESSTAKRFSGKTVIGLTGNIATGKSTVMRLAAEKGALAIDADQVVHALMNHEASIQKAIAQIFGAGVRRPDGTIDRPALAQIVFNDAGALTRLENLLHPAVRRLIRSRIDKCEEEVIVVEAIKLLEGGLAQECDVIWVTDCPESRQIDRLVICRGLDEASARNRVAAQSPQAEKTAKANVVISTGGTLVETRAQIEAAWTALFAPPAPEPEAPAPAPTAVGAEVTVRRARPSDVPGVLLLIHKATDGRVKMKRAELLMALSERSYFIGQVDLEISCVIGMSIDSGIARIDQFYIHPPDAFRTTAPAVLRAIERSAYEHMCEVVLAFPRSDASPLVRAWLAAAGYEKTARASMHRSWQQAVADSQPEGTEVMVKVVANIRNFDA